MAPADGGSVATAGRRMKRASIALALIAAGYLAGTLAPRAAALDSLESVASELRGIRAELHTIARSVERIK